MQMGRGDLSGVGQSGGGGNGRHDFAQVSQATGQIVVRSDVNIRRVLKEPPAAWLFDNFSHMREFAVEGRVQRFDTFGQGRMGGKHVK